MTTKLFEILNIGIMPLNAVRLKKNGDELHLLFLEGETSYAFNEILRPTMQGSSRLVGHRFSATLYVPQNELQNGIAALNNFSRTVLDEVQCDFGKSNADVDNYINNHNLRQTLTIQNAIELTWRLENTELRPRFIVSLAGFVTVASISII